MVEIADRLAFARSGGVRVALAALIATTMIAVAIPASGATSTPLDPSFGVGGVSVVAGSDRYEAQGAPLVGADGRIVVAGLLKNASDRVFLGGLTRDGAIDQSFGAGGSVHTGTKATGRQAATARLSDGRLLIAGRNSSSGKLHLERFSAAGALDPTFGSSGRLTPAVSNSISLPVALATSGDSTFLALTDPTTTSRKGFTVAKLTNTGLDTSFGSGGVATVSFGSTAGQAFDIAISNDGKVLVAGSFGQVGSTTSDTRVIRLLANGTPDPNFDGDGIASFDASQANAADHGVAIVPAGTGAYVVSAAAGKTSVSLLKASGAFDESYANDGIAQGLAPEGGSFDPADAIRDSAGGILVAGESLSGGTTRWALLRTRASGANPLDASFAGGYVLLEECKNTAGNGASGLTSPDPKTILIAGSCGQGASVAVARLLNTETVPLGANLEISPNEAAAGHELIDINNLDPSAVAGQAQTLQGAAIRRTAIRRTAIRRTAIRRTAIRRTAIRRTALSSTLLSEVPLLNTTWQELLGVDVPLQTLTLDDAFEINPEAVGDLTLEDLDPNATAIRRTSLAALVLGVRPLNALPEPEGGWCGFLADQPYGCDQGADPATSTLFDLEVLGDDLSAYYAEPIPLTETDLGTGDERAPLADYLLADMDMAVRPFRDTKAGEAASILACDPNCQGTLADQSEAQLGQATVGDLVGLLPLPSLESLSVGEVLVGLIPAGEIPYELMEEARLLGEAEFRSENLLAYRLPFSVDCGVRGGLSAALNLAGDSRSIPGSASVSVEGGPMTPIDDAETGPGGLPEYNLYAATCSGAGGPTDAELRFDVEPGSVLGFERSSVRIESESGSVPAAGMTYTDDSRDPGDELEQTLSLEPNQIRTGHIQSDTDVDTFAWTGVAGETTISLAHLPADYDLVILGPELGPPATAIRRTAIRRTDLSSAAVPDASKEPTDPAVLAPDTVEDLAIRRTAIRRTAIRRTSVNRGEADEAATVEVRREEEGETFYAQVIGYNGSSDEEPYVIRRTERQAEPAPACPARPLSSSLTAPFPELVPENTEALYLVHPGRMAARDGEPATVQMMDRLAVLAGQTNGVVVPVGSDSTVNTDAAYGAWDQDPCSPERANEVVSGINAVVDHVRAMGNGLPELRSIVIVGPDDVIPQGRVPDHAAIANENEYADDATFDVDGDGDLDETPVSGALRSGYMLSDDPLGDFDPGERLWVPDVALGRLIETPEQVRAQINAFIDAAGMIDPGRAFVTGYDFVSDGATEQRDALSGRVGENNTQSRIDETWTASDAAAGLGAPGSGFLAVNAHYDHYRLLPAAASNGSNPDLLTARQVAPPAGSAIFTIGCHAGLNLAIDGTEGNPDPRLGDWAEEFSARGGSLYAANTGYGYGDTEAVAYSERLMAEYASLLASGDVTAGQALMFAKQTTIASVGVPDDYWSKASMEATFYGLPMYRIGADGGVGEPALPPPAAPQAAAANGPVATDIPAQRSSTELDFDDLGQRLHPVDTDRGTYWQVDDQEPLVVQHRPIQPKTTADVTLEGEGEARAYLLEEMVTTDLRPVDPVIARPTIDTAEHEPEPEANEPLFPARPATVAPEATPDGPRETLTLIAGSFRDDRQRLIQSVEGRVLRSSYDDFQPPTIRRVDGQVDGGSFSVRVEVEGDDALGGNVLYLTDADVAADDGEPLTWHRAELSLVSPNVLATGGVLPSGTRVEEALIQVYDSSYNLAVSNNKVEGYTFAPQPPENGTPRVVLKPDTPASGYYSGAPPTISLEPGPEHADALFEYSLDGDAFRRYDGPFAIDGPIEGEHSVSFRGSDGSTAFRRFAVDTGPPTIIADADSTANGNGWYDREVTVSFVCADAVSGIESCPEPVTLTGEGRDQSAGGTATDRAGNSATVSVEGINIDLTAPSISGQVQSQPNAAGWHKSPVDVLFSCSDQLSGLAVCGDVAVSGAPASANRTVAITAEGSDQSVSRGASDVAGNANQATISDLDIDLSDPQVTITTPGSAVLIGANQRLQGTAFDGVSGVNSVRVTYTSALNGQVVNRDATLSCNANGSCTWTAPLPGTGLWRAAAAVTDKADRTGSTSGPTTINVT